MAPKKKKKTTKKQQVRKQRKQQRRKARVQRRDNQWKGPAQPALRDEDDVMMDMQPFLRMHQRSPDNVRGAEQLMFALIDSYDIVEEPEFEDVIIDPILCVDTVIAVGEERGTTPEKMAELSADKREEAQVELLDECARRMLTDELRQLILATLDTLRLRLKDMGKHSETARIAALQSFLSDENNRTVWYMLGLVQALVQRSLSAGFSLAEASLDTIERMTDNESGDSFLSIIEQADEQKAAALFNNNPAIHRFLDNQIDTMWDEGEEALYQATLFLDLFTEDERQGGADIMMEVLGYDEETGTREREITQTNAPELVGQTLMPRMQAYVADLLTPERLEQLRERLVHIVNEKSCGEKWLGFAYMLMKALQEEDVIEGRIGLLMRMMFGEIRYIAQTQAEE